MAFYAGRALQPVPAGWLSGAAGLGVSWKGTAWLPCQCWSGLGELPAGALAGTF